MADRNDGMLYHNRYRVQRKLGQGGMGEVYLAEDTTLPGRLVALKENSLPDRKTQDQFQREALLLARLQHPNLPRVSDYFRTDDGRQFLVMDYIRGDNLQERLRSTRQPMSEDEVRTCARQLLSALNYLHNWRDPDTGEARPVIHRDIKPANIKQMPDGRYMLLDFGISKASMDEATALSARALTPGYAPIEQYDGGTDARSDIYSLGATLYALLAGKTPPSATGLASGTPLRPVRDTNRGVSRRLASVIERAMAVRSEDRYQSAAEMYQALFDESLPNVSPGPVPAAAGALSAGGASTTGPRQATHWQTASSTLRRNRRYSIPALLLTVGLIWIAVTMILLLRPGQEASVPAIEGAAEELTNSGSPGSTSTPTAGEENSAEVAVNSGNAVTETRTLTPSATPLATQSEIPTVTPTATPTVTVTPTVTETPDQTATAAADEARILDILATRDAKATKNAPTPTDTSEPTSTSTATPISTSTSTPKSTATPKPTATMTPIILPTSTETNVPTSTPAPQPTAVPTIAPTNTPVACGSEPSGPFTNIWRRYQDRLGCPSQSWPSGGFWAEQPFQNGHMFWAQDVKLYLVTVGSDQGWWQRYYDDRTIWNSEMPEYSCGADVPGGLQQPAKGFGSIWCNNNDIRQQIGFATDTERGFGDDMVLYHPFANGAIFRDSDGHTRGRAYVLFGDGTFVREGY